jgi:hypothetical protein
VVYCKAPFAGPRHQELSVGSYYIGTVGTYVKNVGRPLTQRTIRAARRSMVIIFLHGSYINVSDCDCLKIEC